MLSLRLIMFVFGSFFVLESMAYSCKEEIDFEILLIESDVALVGNIKEKLFDLSFSKDKYLVAVESTQKGETEREIVVWTESKCRARFAVGQRYVIFMNLMEGKLWTNLNLTWRIYGKTQLLTEKYLEHSIKEFAH